MWLIRKKGKKVKAHIWLGNDTVCRMYSTGGMKPTRYETSESRDEHEISHMCATLNKTG